jgi:hypothetical protein
LRRESEINQTSLNTLASQIFRQHNDWHSKAAKAGYVPLPKQLIMRFLDEIPEEQVIRISEDVTKNFYEDIMLLLRNEIDIDSTLDLIETWIRISGFQYKHEINDGDVHSYVIQHDMGRKFSDCISTLYRFVFQKLGLTKVEFIITEHTVAFKVETGKAALARDY